MSYRLRWIDGGLYHDSLNHLRFNKYRIRLVVKALGVPRCRYRIELVRAQQNAGSIRYKPNSGKFVIRINLWPYHKKHGSVPKKIDSKRTGHCGFNLNAHYWATLIHELAHSHCPPWTEHGQAWRDRVKVLTVKFLRKFVRLHRARSKEA